MFSLLTKVDSWLRGGRKSKAAGSVDRSKKQNRRCRVETLEPRTLLAASPLHQDATTVSSWSSYRDQTESAWTATFEANRKSSIPVDIEIADAGSGSPSIASIWNANSDSRGWALWRNMTATRFGERWEEYRTKNYRLADQEIYSLGGKTYYAGIWVQNKEGVAWASKRDMSETAYKAFVDQYDGNYLPVDVDVTSIGGSLKYAAIFVRNTSNVAWSTRHGLTSSGFSSLFDQMKSNYRVTDIESYQVSGQQRYAVTWVRNTNGRAWASLRDMSETSYWNNWNKYTDEGYRPVDFERYQTASGWRYAGVWRQDGSRFNWNLKSKVDALALKELKDFKVPGLSVTVMQNGTFLYRRGFGSQNEAAGLNYSSMTINRLASVSKAVAGVLALDLDEKGLLDIDKKTRSYVPSMPKAHTHTLEQLLSNRAGIGHYDELGEPSGAYATALAASKAFWSKALVDKPGETYHYSTHGYTLLGAAIESALNMPIQQAVKQYLTDPYKLGTLNVENRGVFNRYRSALYAYYSKTKETKAITADNTSWKILGGGLEASGVDLALFGAKLLAGNILTSSSRNTMWTAPDSKARYGLGWDLGTTSGVKYAAKSGGQTGANTYILMYPEKGIVITVLSNRQGGGHSAGTLAKQIGSLLVK